ncbi:MAG: phasin family protein [Rhizobiaceae bacterium]|nr:phasin family protein [Rhizobiaceae bacterium]MBL4696548.1 phasin family protein [Rhizobiaceae bacterium]
MTATAKTKASVKATPAFEMPKFDATAFDFTKMNETFRDFAEKGAVQQEEMLGKFKTAAEEAKVSAEETLAVVRGAGDELSAKAMENVKTNTEAGTAFLEKMMGVKSFSEAFELQGEFFRSQFEVVSAQVKDATELTTKVGEKAIAPAKAAFEKASN